MARTCAWRPGRPRALSGARGHRVSGGGPAAPAGLRPRGKGGRREDRARDARDHRARRVSPPRCRSLQRVLRPGSRRGSGRLPEALPPELRRLRRRPLLRARARPDAAPLRRRSRRAHRLRGPVAAGAARDRPGSRRRAADRQHLGVAVPRRQGPRARGDAAGSRTRQHVLRRALQHGRRPGRADLRRPLGRDRRRRPGRRTRGRLRGGAARRRRRPGVRDRPSPPRRPTPGAGAGTQAARGSRPRASAAGGAEQHAAIPRPSRRSTISSRCGSHSSSVSTTT